MRHLEDRSGENTCIVRVRLKTWKRTSIHGLVVDRLVKHRLISGGVHPWEWPLAHADIKWIEVLPRMNGRREIRMHELLLFLNFELFRELTARAKTSSQ